MKCLLLLLFFSSLFATFSEPFTFEIQTGYREDSLKWRLERRDDTNLDIYREQYNHLWYLQSNLVFKSINRDIYLLAEGGYGTFGKGSIDQNSIKRSSMNTELSYPFRADAETVYGKGFLGYFVNLTPMRYYRIGLIPLFGYSVYHTKIERYDPTPPPFHTTSSNTDVPDQLFSSLEKDLKLQWYGPFLGGMLHIYPGRNFVFEIGYYYHWIQMRQIVYNEFLMPFFGPNKDIVGFTNQIQKGKVWIGKNLGYEGILKATYLFPRHINLSVLGKFFYFSALAKGVRLEQLVQQVAPAGVTTKGVIERDYKGLYIFWVTLFAIDFLL